MSNGTGIPHDRRLGWKPLRYLSQQNREIELPFVIGIVADLSGNSDAFKPRFYDNKFVQVDRDNLCEFMRRLKPRLTFKVPYRLDLESEGENLAVELYFESLEDFHPDTIITRIEPLKILLEKRSQLAMLNTHLEIRPALQKQLKTLLRDEDCIAELTRSFEEDEVGLITGPLSKKVQAMLDALREPMDRHFNEHQRFRLLQTLVSELSRHWRDTHISENKNALVVETDALIAEIDRLCSLQMDEILHYPSLQQLEASWRGLNYLTLQLETGDLLKIRVFNATKADVRKDLAKAVEVQQSQLFKKIYEEEAYILGGEPFSLLLFDYFFDHSATDMDILDDLSWIGAASNACIIAGASPGIMQMDSFQELLRPRVLSKIFDALDYTRWRRLRENENSRYLLLTMPRLLARRPWDTSRHARPGGFAYGENTEQHENFLWMNGGYGLLAVIGNAFARDRWCADIRGSVWGRIDGLPAHFVIEDGHIVDVIGPTEVDASNRRQYELQDLGFTFLTRHRRGEYAAILTPTVLTKPRIYGDTPGNERESLMLQIENLLCINRVSMTLISFLQSHSGYWDDWEKITGAVQEWLAAYIAPEQESADKHEKDQLLHPFKSACVNAHRIESTMTSAEGYTIELQLELNYLPKGKPVSHWLIVAVPPGMVSCRLIP